MKTKKKKVIKTKRVPKNDLGYGTKKVTLDEIGMTTSDFDLLDGMFGGNPVDEFEDIMDGVFNE